MPRSDDNTRHEAQVTGIFPRLSAQNLQYAAQADELLFIRPTPSQHHAVVGKGTRSGTACLRQLGSTLVILAACTTTNAG